jgi:tetratricopeptide (TPR) repeat protein
MCLRMVPLRTACFGFVAPVLLATSPAPVLAQAGAAPQHAASQKAPWQRLLTGDEAKRVAELEVKIYQLRRDGQYADALAAAQTILEVRSRVQGTNHWETGDARRLVQTLKQIAALPRGAQDLLAQVEEQDNQIARMHSGGSFAHATPLLEQALDIRKQHLGEEHVEVATAMDRVATNLEAQGKYGQAEPLFRKALALFQKLLGEEHPATAWGYNNLAHTLLCITGASSRRGNIRAARQVSN